MAIVERFFVKVQVLAGELRDREQGQGMTEYAILLGVLIVGLSAAVVALRTQIIDALNNINIP